MAGLIGLNEGTEGVTGFRPKEPVVSMPTVPPEDFIYVPEYRPITNEQLEQPEVVQTTTESDNDGPERESGYMPGLYTGTFEPNKLPFMGITTTAANAIGAAQLEYQQDAVENKKGITFTNPSGRPVTVHEGLLGGLVITGNRGNVPQDVYFDAYRKEQGIRSELETGNLTPGTDAYDRAYGTNTTDKPESKVNQHGLDVGAYQIRDDQDSATSVGGGGEIYYSSDHDWSQPTQTHVPPPESDNDSGGGGGGCFLTTAIVDRRGEADDGVTLTKLRKFRDEFMGGKNSDDLVEYYSIAPVLVDTIPANHPDWDWIERQIDLSVAAIDDNDYHKAYNIYKNMVLVLKTNWVGE